MTPGAPPVLPETCGIAFKEWEGVCDALARGRQSLILRKGGIEEGLGGFAPEHPAFWLYPTRVHQAEQGLKPEAARALLSLPPGGAVDLRALAVVEQVFHVQRLDRLESLDDLHVWTAETVEKRFHYRTPGLWVLGVRIFRRDDPVRVSVTPEHAGCKTWVPLEIAPGTRGMRPALDDIDFRAVMARLHSALGPSPDR